MRQCGVWVVAVLTTLLGVLAACGPDSPPAPGGGGTGGTGSSDQHQQALAFAACMRDNGLPDFPDPGPDGAVLAGSSVDRGSPQFASALEACQDLLPSGGEDNNAPDVAQFEQMKKYAACMRDNGMPEFPDPGPDGFAAGAFNVNDPAFTAASRACKEFLTWR
jgi:hypothetical protein